ncbi:hypothetical protein ACOMHN_019470 [Nucella lapillus]
MTSLPVLLAVTLSVLQYTATLPASLLTSQLPSAYDPALERLLNALFYDALRNHYARHSPRPRGEDFASAIPRGVSAPVGKRPSTIFSIYPSLPHGRHRTLKSILRSLVQPQVFRRTSAVWPGDREREEFSWCLNGQCYRGRIHQKAKPHIRSAMDRTTHPPSLFLLGGAVGR